MDVARWSFVGGTEVEIRRHASGLVHLGEHRWSYRVADPADGISPVSSVAVVEQRFPERAVDLIPAQALHRSVDVLLHRGEGLGVFGGADRGVDESAHRLREGVLD